MYLYLALENCNFNLKCNKFSAQDCKSNFDVFNVSCPGILFQKRLSHFFFLCVPSILNLGGIYYKSQIRLGSLCHFKEQLKSIYCNGLSNYRDFLCPFSTNYSFFSSLNVSETLYQHRINQYMGLNQQLYDLGLPLVDLYKLDAIKVR